MKKLAIAAVMILGTLPMIVLQAPQVQAIHWATKCRHHTGPDGAGGADANICVKINARDPLWEQTEAYADWTNNSPTGTFFDIRFYYIRYLRVQADGTGSDIVERKETDVVFDSRFAFRYSTDWYDHCLRADNRYFYSVIAYQVIWYVNGGPADPGPSYDLSSYQKFIAGCHL